MPVPYTDESAIVSGINTKLDELNVNLALIVSDLSTIKSDVTTIKNTLLDTSSEISLIKTELQNANVHLDSIDSTISEIQIKLIDIEYDIETTNTKLDTANTNLNNIETDIETTNTNLNDIETDIETTNTKLDTVNTNLNDIETDVETTNDKLDDVNDELDNITTEEILIGNDVETIKNVLLDASSLINIELDDTRDYLEEMRQASKNAVPKAAALLSEFQSSEDMDQNGLVYGKDFMIDENDDNFPKMLFGIHNSALWEDPDTTYTWAQYLATLPPE